MQLAGGSAGPNIHVNFYPTIHNVSGCQPWDASLTSRVLGAARFDAPAAANGTWNCPNAGPKLRLRLWAEIGQSEPATVTVGGKSCPIDSWAIVNGTGGAPALAEILCSLQQPAGVGVLQSVQLTVLDPAALLSLSSLAVPFVSFALPTVTMVACACAPGATARACD